MFCQASRIPTICALVEAGGYTEGDIFTGAVQGEVTYLIDKIGSATGKVLTLASGMQLQADVLVSACTRSDGIKDVPQ